MAGGGRSRRILIAGGGIAGLTAALAFAGTGRAVTLFERAAAIDPVGAGLQLSPNATRLLGRLGALDALRRAATRPEAVVLRRAGTLAELARIPLGEAGERRWGAPYLVAHRADLQAALLARCGLHKEIEIVLGARVADMAGHPGGVTLSVDREGRIEEARGGLLVAADGVWSRIRDIGDRTGHAASGLIAWRATLQGDASGMLPGAEGGKVVTAFLDGKFHLVAYPMRGGASVNLVAVTPGAGPSAGAWSTQGDRETLRRAMAQAHPQLRALAEQAGPWSTWPIHTVDPQRRWTSDLGIALAGDAAHAMTPFAAQGAAMAIEDAVVLAARVTAQPDDLPAALAAYEAARKPRVARVVKRGALNRLAWHASGPVALGRDMVLRALGPARLATQLDWLYGFDAAAS